MTEKLKESLSIDTDEMDKYERYCRQGKEAARQGDLSKSLELFCKACEIRPSDKLKRRIQTLQEAIRQQAAGSSDEEEEEEEFVNVNNSGLMLYKELYDKLYDHQKEGVAFLYSLYRDGRKGGILADDMGLGKTIQVISFLSGMYDAELVKNTLLIMPTSLIKNWVREFAKWTPGMRVKEFHGTSKAERNRNLERIQRRGGVLITTYQMLINNWQQLASYGEQEFRWDYVILDEAHKIKTSSTKTAKSAHCIPAKHRVLLTGTPVQNNLREMWALFDFACQGALLGTSKTFKTEYENPITRAREKDATPGEKALGLKISENLMNIISPYFLRRTKAEVQNRKHKEDNRDFETVDKENKDPNQGMSLEMPKLSRKNDFIVWTYLSSVQEHIYNQFISLDHIKELLMTTRSPLAELTVLKKLCDHPRLLSARAVTQLGLEEGSNSAALEDESESAASRIDNISDETLISESGKLRFLISLLDRLREEGKRTLVFSQSRKMLDIIERVLVNKGFKLLRIDGTVTHLAEREKRITQFQTNKHFSVFLLTTQVGGVGITLTAANRVVIFDPSWNPATDAQAVDRAYRIGQTENVVIYRLITCGTVEEKIYRRQVFKDSLIRQTTGDKKNPFRYFSKQELKELFTLEDTRSSSTQQQLQALHGCSRKSDLSLDQHIAYLHTMEMFGLSDHDLMFSRDAAADEDDPEDVEAGLYIQNRVLKAQELVKAESELHGQLMDSMAQNTEPAWLRLSNQRGSQGSTEKEPRPHKPKPKPSPLSPHYSGQSICPIAVVDLTQSGSEDRAQSEEDRNYLSSSEEVQIIDENEEMNMKNESLLSNEGIADSSVQEMVANTEADTSRSSDPGVLVVEDNLNLEDECSSYASEKQQNDQPLLKVENSSIHTERLENEDENDSAVQSLKHPKLSILQMSALSQGSHADTSSKLDADLESFHGNFNLQLEDSIDMFQDGKEDEDEEAEVSAGNAEFQLQMEVSGTGLGDDEEEEQSFGNTPAPQTPGDDSFLHSVRRKKKKAHVLCDTDEEEEAGQEEERPCLASSPLVHSFVGLGSSTPKSRMPDVISRRKSVGGNTSVASRRSLIESVMEDLDEEMYESTSSSVFKLSQASEASGTQGDLSVMEEEEPSGETLNTENEYETAEEEESKMMSTSEKGMSREWEEEEGDEEEESPLEESTGDVELSSSETMDQCAPKARSPEEHVVNSGSTNGSAVPESPAVSEEEAFNSLVQSGKQCLAEGKKQEALNMFLSAIDIRSGDPELQLLTIQLYRQLSQQNNP
ncbi:DNA excision repair protein ERCC-6-like [Chanos chanos]|uniref:DNA excision repair protein ERCC-6-like n=1 Tax=Chanos chanos TaxID=29144 RepID=A0A6J2W678_CHACN|nr:DNA excision repair protein ERCC-6-like [Chanos chanos]